MARFRAIVNRVDAWNIKNDETLRVFAIQVLSMTGQQVNRAIRAAVDDGEYPMVRLQAGSPPIHARVGWYISRTDDGDWRLSSPDDFTARFEPDTSSPQGGPSPI